MNKIYNKKGDALAIIEGDVITLYLSVFPKTHTVVNNSGTVSRQLMAWQKFALSRIKSEEFVETPLEMREQFGAGMWRYGLYEDFLYDTVMQNGCISAATLSMLYHPKVIVEFGIYGGHTTMLLCKFNPEAKVYGVDLNEKHNTPFFEFPVGYKASINNCKNLEIITGKPSWEFVKSNVDLCFIDGDHCGDAPYKDSLRAWENRNKDGDWCIAWDDYHPNNPDVYKAVHKFTDERSQILQKISTWVWIGSKSMSETSLSNIGVP